MSADVDAESTAQAVQELTKSGLACLNLPL
jgi:hypothetical protein